MKVAIRAGLAAVVAAAALAVAVSPAGATTAKSGQAARVFCRLNARSAASDTVGDHATGARLAANPNTISAAAYNQARSILARAGSETAAKSHPIHGTRDVPVRYGTTLLACSRDEFRAKDRNVPVKRSGMSTYHYVAIHDAARTMGIDRW
ncbi:hypothetical protein [Streptomyces silvisoli]|uniref:SCP domain-containing protein n=1 Tax=Streptomyces silvisoli TaxID=3034235 RepID=A0ABT5ZVK2_9ACTN|nr:hypothetical protein [Streptomyces silvisoli]MDF3293063.1 hypothetical protein [Streptomyces silvisoli]